MFSCLSPQLYTNSEFCLFLIFLKEKVRKKQKWVTRLSALVQLHSITDFLSNPNTISCLLLSWAIKISAIYVLTDSFSHTSLRVDMPFFLFYLNMRVKRLTTSGNLAYVSLTKNLCFHYLFSWINIKEREKLALLMNFLKIIVVNLVSIKIKCC